MATFLLNGCRLGIRRLPDASCPPTLARPAAGHGPTYTEYPHPPDLAGLYPHQRDGVRWLREHRRALLADEMRLGKTVQVLRALPRRARAIVVCPGFLRGVWRDAAARWRPDLRAHVCRPGELDLPAADTGDVVIMSYESLPETDRRQRRLFPAQNLADCALIVDEAHYCKNHKAARTVKIRQLASQCARAWALTGTPLTGHPFDLWGVLSTFGLARGAFGSWDSFLECFGARRDRWGGYSFENPNGDVRELLAPVMLRRRRADVMPDLPRKTYEDIATDVPVEVMAMLDGVATQWSAADGDLPPFEMLSAVRAELARHRIPALLDHVARYEEAGLPLLVFSAHRAPVLALAGRPGWGVITGDTPVDARERLVALYQEGLLSGLAGTIAAMGVGLDLTRGAHVLFCDMSYVPAENSQAEDRAVGPSQEAKSVSVARMVSRHPVERRLLEIIDRKQRLIEGTIG